MCYLTKCSTCFQDQKPLLNLVNANHSGCSWCKWHTYLCFHNCQMITIHFLVHVQSNREIKKYHSCTIQSGHFGHLGKGFHLASQSKMQESAKGRIDLLKCRGILLTPKRILNYCCYTFKVCKINVFSNSNGKLEQRWKVGNIPAEMK